MNVALLAVALALHLGNLLVPAIDFDESIHVNVGATLGRTGEYGNTWETGTLQAPDRTSSTGLPLLLPVALAWNLGARTPVALRLAVLTPFFVAFLWFFNRSFPEAMPLERATAAALLLAVPGWAYFSARVLGEIPALCWTLLGALLLLGDRSFLGSLCWGMAGAIKLVYFPALLFGWTLWCLTVRRNWKLWLLVAVGAAVPLLAFQAWILVRYGAPADLALLRQGFIVLFHPRNLPLNLESLNRFLPLSLLALAYLFAWSERERAPRLYFFCCLSSFWILWHLVGFRGWLRYVMPGLLLLVPPLAAALVRLARQELPLYAKAPFFVAAALAFLGGLYVNSYSIWTSYKSYRDQSLVVRFLQTHGDRRRVGVRPFPEYQWLIGQRFLDRPTVKASPGDLLLVSDGREFLRLEMDAGRLAVWSRLLATADLEIYEMRSPDPAPGGAALVARP